MVMADKDREARSLPAVKTKRQPVIPIHKYLLTFYQHKKKIVFVLILQGKQQPDCNLTEIKDNGYKSVFTNSWLVRQRNRSWIKRLKIHKRVSLFIAGSAFCPGLPNRDPMDSKKHLRVYTSTSSMARHPWRVNKKLQVYTASDVNWLTRYLP